MIRWWYEYLLRLSADFAEGADARWESWFPTAVWPRPSSPAYCRGYFVDGEYNKR